MVGRTGDAYPVSPAVATPLVMMTRRTTTNVESTGGRVSHPARPSPRPERRRLVDRSRPPHPLDGLVSGHEVDVVEVGQQRVDEPLERVEVLGAGEQPVGVQVNAERRAGCPVEPAEVVPEVGERVAETSSLRLGGAVARVDHRTRPPRPVNHYHISRESKTTRNVLWSRASVCLSVRGRTTTLLHRPGCNLGAW